MHPTHVNKSNENQHIKRFTDLGVVVNKDHDAFREGLRVEQTTKGVELFHLDT